MPIDKPVEPAGTQPSQIPGTVGVYELVGTDGEVIYIGAAGGRTLFGLRGLLTQHFSADEPNPAIRDRAAGFRYEITTNYLIRRLDLLARFQAQTGHLPAANELAHEALPPLARYPRSAERQPEAG